MARQHVLHHGDNGGDDEDRRCVDHRPCAAGTAAAGDCDRYALKTYGVCGQVVLRQASLGVSALVKVAETPAEKVAIAAQLRLVDSGPLGLLPVLCRKDLQPGW